MKPLKFRSPHKVNPHETVRLANIPTVVSSGPKDEDAAAPLLAKDRAALDKLQEVFYASQTHALLIVLQGMDTAGKDGTIRHIFSGINPQGCAVTSFKTPTPIELRHDFLWRAHLAVPPRGMIGIFNRSHYEDLLFPRVHGEITHKQVKNRVQDINQFEEMLWDNRVITLKFFLHISHEEQTRRLEARIDNPDKQWKLSPSDFAERKFRPEYQEAYEYLLTKTSTKTAPWFIIPSDHKWQGHLAISHVLVEAMKQLKLHYPKPEVDPSTVQL